MAAVTTQPGLRIHCADRTKADRLAADDFFQIRLTFPGSFATLNLNEYRQETDMDLQKAIGKQNRMMHMVMSRNFRYL